MSAGDADDAALERLLERMRGGDIAALETFYDLTSPLVYGLALATAEQGAEAERLTRDVYLAVWRRASSGRVPKGPVRSWLTAVTMQRLRHPHLARVD